MFARRKRLARIAAAMLLAWLFALGSAVAHACVIGADAQPVSMAGPCDGTMDMSGDVSAAAPCPATCCDDGTSLAPTVVKTGADAWLVSVLAAPALPCAVPAWPRESAARAPCDDPRAQRAAVPIPIAFLRLAL